MIARAVREHLPQYDYAYIGDTLHVPYGGRSEAAIREYSRRCVEFLFQQDCQIIVVACNTASASALRWLQQHWLPAHYPERRILGVIVPTLEAALDSKAQNIGLLCTGHLAHSKMYDVELEKLAPDMKLHTSSAPLLVPLIENDGLEFVDAALEKYLTPLLAQNIETLILGCTHYPYLKDRIQVLAGGIPLLSQDEIIPVKVADYLARHLEHEVRLSQNGQMDFYVTDITPDYAARAAELFGQSRGEAIPLEKVDLHSGVGYNPTLTDRVFDKRVGL